MTIRDSWRGDPWWRKDPRPAWPQIPESLTLRVVKKFTGAVITKKAFYMDVCRRTTPNYSIRLSSSRDVELGAWMFRREAEANANNLYLRVARHLDLSNVLWYNSVSLPQTKRTMLWEPELISSHQRDCRMWDVGSHPSPTAKATF